MKFCDQFQGILKFPAANSWTASHLCPQVQEPPSRRLLLKQINDCSITISTLTEAPTQVSKAPLRRVF